jgi:hypothetical protein
MPVSKKRKNRKLRSTALPSLAPPKSQPPSPTWYVVLMFGLMAVGVILVILNYVVQDPFAPWGLWLGLGGIAVGFFMTTNYT